MEWCWESGRIGRKHRLHLFGVSHSYSHRLGTVFRTGVVRNMYQTSLEVSPLALALSRLYIFWSCDVVWRGYYD
jgi:hypothetical protein